MAKCGDSILSSGIGFNATPNWCGAKKPGDVAIPGKAGIKGEKGWAVRNMFGFHKAADAFATWPDYWCEIFSNSPPWYTIPLLAPVYMFAALCDAILSLMVPPGCDEAGLAATIAQRAIQGVAERWLGMQFPVVNEMQQHTLDYSCPSVIVLPNDAIAAWTHGTMTAAEASEWCKANGWCQFTADMAMDAAKYRTSPGQLVDLWHRGVIGTEDQLRTAMQHVGVIDQIEQTRLIEGAWTLWDVGTIYTALHRLRQNRVEAHLVYSEAEARQDLRSLGYKDDKIEKMIELATNPLSYRQLLAPYERGAIERDNVYEALIDDGIAPHDAGLLMEYYDDAKTEYQWKSAGGPGVEEIVKATAAGEMSPDVFMSELKAQGVTQEQTETAARLVIATRQQQARATAIAAARAGLRSGELSPDDAIGALMAQQVPSDAAGNIVSQWLAEWQYERKPIGAPQLCQWVAQGLLPVSEYKMRLRRLGYSETDVRRIMAVCELGAQKKAETAAAAKQRAIDANNARAARAAQMAARTKTAEDVKAARAAAA